MSFADSDRVRCSVENGVYRFTLTQRARTTDDVEDTSPSWMIAMDLPESRVYPETMVGNGRVHEVTSTCHPTIRSLVILHSVPEAGEREFEAIDSCVRWAGVDRHRMLDYYHIQRIRVIDVVVVTVVKVAQLQVRQQFNRPIGASRDRPTREARRNPR